MKASGAMKKFMNEVSQEKCSANSVFGDILIGLNADQKYIPSKYFYDATGADLFEQICDLPEYYQTRTELKLLSDHATEIVMGFGPGDLVEFGSGSSRKIRILLDAIGCLRMPGVCYIPVDVCRETLAKSSQELRRIYPSLSVEPVVADFAKVVDSIRMDASKLILFLGSTIGNLNEDESSLFLENVARIMNPEDRFLIGLDMLKPVQFIEAAYNDSQGVTARFNKNILNVINRETGANFKTDLFQHVAYFNERQEQVEIYLKAKDDISVDVERFNRSFHIARGETIRTEICRKYSSERAEEMLRQAGMRVRRWFRDHRGWFSIVEAVI